jgi:hypothetical protein
MTLTAYNRGAMARRAEKGDAVIGYRRGAMAERCRLAATSWEQRYDQLNAMSSLTISDEAAAAIAAYLARAEQPWEIIARVRAVRDDRLRFDANNPQAVEAPADARPGSYCLCGQPRSPERSAAPVSPPVNRLSADRVEERLREYEVELAKTEGFSFLDALFPLSEPSAEHGEAPSLSRLELHDE